MLPPENRYRRQEQPLRRFDPSPYMAAAHSLRPPARNGAAIVWAWATVLILVPMFWTATIVWAVDRLF